MKRFLPKPDTLSVVMRSLSPFPNSRARYARVPTEPTPTTRLRSQKGVHVRSVILASASEAYAANCVRVNDVVLVAAGYPRMTGSLEKQGCRTVPLDMSEFRKMDGGLSCLSLRF